MKSNSERTGEAAVAGAAPCSAIPSAQVLIFQPELTHSVWTDVMHRKRSRKSLEAMLRKGVRSGEYVGYRLLTIEAEYMGISWPNDPKLSHAAGDCRQPKTRSENCPA